MRGRRRTTNPSSPEPSEKGDEAPDEQRTPRRSRRRATGGLDQSSELVEPRKRPSRTEPVSATQRKTRKVYTDDEVADMWLYVVHRIRDPVTQKIIKPRLKWRTVWAEYIEFSESTRDIRSLDLHFKRSCKKLWSTTFDLQTKTNLHYALGLPVESEEFFAELQEVADVVFDSKNRIIAYRKKRRDGAMISQEEDYWDEVWDEEAIAKSADGVLSPSRSMERDEIPDTEGEDSGEEEDRNEKEEIGFEPR